MHVCVWARGMPARVSCIPQASRCNINHNATSRQSAPANHVELQCPFPQVNIFDNGGVCLSILKDDVPEHLGNVSGWRPSFTVKSILLAIQVGVGVGVLTCRGEGCAGFCSPPA